ncbi:acetoacetate decarboxylase family protein [Flavisphingomonas formosensis]|uniref:acetoacetate decarboxylase family protein n=1 Tax=Flavisphingomonas formosensis TaxID=861534 RepID=UPI0012F92F37|nr:acetoacetate decarboxylase family protein [Sphingomonas formosensis]
MNSGTYIGGILNLTGAMPGDGFQYDGPAMPSYPVYMVMFRSTHDAIERFILQPPLKADRSEEPIVKMWYFVNPQNRAIDGQVTPYHAVQFAAPCIHNGRKGQSGWEYVDGLRGDKTSMDIMGPWSVYFGMAKKMGDISFIPVAPDEFEITVDRRGTRLVTMGIRIGAELTGEQLDAVRAQAVWPEQMTVRAIPSPDYSHFTQYAVCATSTEEGNSIDRAWLADKASVVFGHLDMDPLDELPVLEITGAYAVMNTTHKIVFTEMRVIDDLLQSADIPVPTPVAVD